MKTNVTRHALASAIAAVFLSAPSTGRGENSIYVWSSLDGNPDGISATIVLNSPSYSGGFDASRILSVTLSSAVSSTYYVTVPDDIYAWGSIMTWGPAGITEMVLGLSRGQPNPSWILIADENNLYGFYPYARAFIEEYCGGPLIAGDDFGAWVPMIPEPALIRLSLFVMILGFLHRICRTGSKQSRSRRWQYVVGRYETGKPGLHRLPIQSRQASGCREHSLSNRCGRPGEETGCGTLHSRWSGGVSSKGCVHFITGFRLTIVASWKGVSRCSWLKNGLKDAENLS